MEDTGLQGSLRGDCTHHQYLAIGRYRFPCMNRHCIPRPASSRSPRITQCTPISGSLSDRIWLVSPYHLACHLSNCMVAPAAVHATQPTRQWYLDPLGGRSRLGIRVIGGRSRLGTLWVRNFTMGTYFAKSGPSLCITPAGPHCYSVSTSICVCPTF